MESVTLERLMTAFTLVLVSCGGTQAPKTTVEKYTWEVADLEELGMLLLLEDRRQFDPFTVDRTRQAGPQVRAELAEALGRIGDPLGLPVLEQLLVDPEAIVRRGAAFGLGLLGDGRGLEPLLVAVSDPDRETGRTAVASLAILGADLEKVLAVLKTLPPEEIWLRLLPSLFRFPKSDSFALAQQALGLEQAQQRRQAVYALARDPVPQAAPLLRELLQDADPAVRGWAARALGRVGDGQDLEAMLPLLDGDPTPVVQALRAGMSLIEHGRIDPPATWIPDLLRLMQHPDPGVSNTATEATSAWLPDELLAEALVERVISASGRQQEVAFLALARGGDSRAVALLQSLVRDADPRKRALAATAAAELDTQPVLEALLLDPMPEVRLAAVTGIVELESELVEETIELALADPDPAIRGRALEWAAEHPEVPADLLEGALSGPPLQPVELYLNGTAALLARALVEPLDRGEIVRILEELASRSDYPVRVLAASALEDLGRPRPAPGPANIRRTAATYREMLRRAASPRYLELHTRHGITELRLDCPTAPLTCLNFLQLVHQGFYDGLRFHRVVPDFVVQGGDPRGDGWGGPGYTIRDELNRKPFGRGVMGMALAGPDTGGSQFFITLSPQPHLDTAFTAFGEATAGFEALVQLEQGDRIERLVEVPGRH